jgi:hypothetical protein
MRETLIGGVASASLQVAGGARGRPQRLCKAERRTRGDPAGLIVVSKPVHEPKRYD